MDGRYLAAVDVFGFSIVLKSTKGGTNPFEQRNVAADAFLPDDGGTRKSIASFDSLL